MSTELNPFDKIPEEMRLVIDIISKYIGDLTTDWVVVKKEISNKCKNHHRKLLSKKHYSTQKHSLNEFEYLVIEYWKHLTGNTLEIPLNKLHPSTWVRVPRLELLRRFNEKRRELKQNAKQAK